jgi:uncharacterized protein (DUF305 family)
MVQLKQAITAIIIAVGALTFGCQSQHGHHDQAGSPHKSMAPAKTDGALAAMLVEHHGGAIRLSDAVIARGQDPQVRAIAQKMKDQQSKEIPELQRIQSAEGGTATMSEDMKKKQAEAERDVNRAQGHDADHAFLKHMIEHHQDGIAMIQASKPNLKNARLISMVDNMVSTQQKEVTQMKEMNH